MTHLLVASGFDLIYGKNNHYSSVKKSILPLNVKILEKEENKIVKNFHINRKKPLSLGPIKNYNDKRIKSYQKAKLKGKYRPEYPELSWELGEEGEVVVKVFVDQKGLVENVKLIKSSGYLRLDHSILSSIRREKFIPAKRNNQYVHDSLNYKFSFRLN